MDNKAFFYQLYKETAEQFQTEIQQHVPGMMKTFPENDQLRMISLRFVAEGGKRLRPVLARIAARSFGVDDRGVVASLEAFHKFLLCHDDIIDRDSMRYGGKTVHSALEELQQVDLSERTHYGNSLGIVAGDLISSMSHQFILNSRLSNDKKVALLSLSMQALDEVAWGWYDQFCMDYEPLSSARLSYERIEKSVIWVTGKYSISFPLRFGFTLADEAMPQELEEVSDLLGVLFQTGDDMIGLLGDSKKSGKSNFSDISQGKKTIPLWFTYELCTDVQKSRLGQLIGKKDISPNEVEEVRKLVHDTGAYDRTQKFMRKYSQQIHEKLDKIVLKDDFKKFMIGFAEYLCERES